MKEVPAGWVRCQPSKCRHNKAHCARFTSAPSSGTLKPMDLSIFSNNKDRCAGYEWNGVK